MAKKHETKLKTPDRELGNGSYKLSCNYDGEKIGQIRFSRGSIEITIKEGRKILGQTGKIRWKDFFAPYLED